MNPFPNLTILTLTPLLGAAVVIGLPAARPQLVRRLAMGVSFLSLAWAVLLWNQFDPAASGLQFVQRYAWIPSIGVNYFVGADGLSMVMVLLTSVVVLMALLASGRIADQAPLFYGLVLLLQGGLFGAFTAMNFFHWFLFWELTLIPAFFLVKLWGGQGRGPAAMQFFLYTMAGSVALLLAFLAIFRATGQFDFPALAALGRSGELPAAVAMKLATPRLDGEAVMTLLFLAVVLGFAIKTPLMPFHTWLPATYAEAPTGVTMLLTGVMSKLGVYGFLRLVLPIFPQQSRALLVPLLGLAVVTVVVSACAAFAQRDLKRTLAYSSINHLGYCLLGLFAVAAGSAASVNEQAAALNGVMLQMFNHGVTAAALFAAVGLLEERSGGLRGLEDFGGLRKIMPVFCGLMGIALLASLGLPGLSGFVGEFLIFKGVFALAPWAAAFSTLGLLVTAIFILTILQKVFNGPLNARWRQLSDLTPAERLLLAPPVVIMLALGIWPAPLVDLVNAAAVSLANHLNF